MKEARHDESSLHTQIERLLFFSDGVFAICITLLIIEIKVPELQEFTDHALWENLRESGLKFLGFLISFGVVGHYWSVHHRIFGYVKKYTATLLWLNLGFLLSIVTLPFSSGLVGEFSAYEEMQIPYAIYAINICLTALMNTWLWNYVSNPKRNLLTRKLSASRRKLGVYRSLIIPFVFILSMLVSMSFPLVGKVLLLIIPITLHWGMKGIEKKADQQEFIGD